MSTTEPSDQTADVRSPEFTGLAKVAPQARQLFEALASPGGASDPALLAKSNEWVEAARAALRVADGEFAAMVTASHRPTAPPGAEGGDE